MVVKGRAAPGLGAAPALALSAFSTKVGQSVGGALRSKAVVPANKTLIRAGLEALYFTGSHLALRPFFGVVGAILMLHHVRPARSEAFQPNRLLEVTPEYLEKVIVSLRRADVDLVSLDEAHRRLAGQVFWRRFVCFTLDDGYRD